MDDRRTPAQKLELPWCPSLWLFSTGSRLYDVIDGMGAPTRGYPAPIVRHLWPDIKGTQGTVQEMNAITNNHNTQFTAVSTTVVVLSSNLYSRKNYRRCI
mmetsp:Transcript_31246/g.61868  ORF Transcript_31246/g.61868 Transcript_31246/m.61868 type:complete len:100 (+) Transcript_31246:978-1277(+)